MNFADTDMQRKICEKPQEKRTPSRYARASSKLKTFGREKNQLAHFYDEKFGFTKNTMHMKALLPSSMKFHELWLDLASSDVID